MYYKPADRKVAALALLGEARALWPQISEAQRSISINVVRRVYQDPSLQMATVLDSVESLLEDEASELWSLPYKLGVCVEADSRCLFVQMVRDLVSHLDNSTHDRICGAMYRRDDLLVELARQ